MVNWSEPATADLRKIHDYISTDSKFYAKMVIIEIVDNSANLDEFPRMGRIVPEIGNQNIREIIIYSYRLIYEIISDKIEILAVIHGQQDFSSENLKR